MQKSIKLAFLGLILTSVAAPAVCKTDNKTAPVNTKQKSFFSKVAPNKYAKVAMGLGVAYVGTGLTALLSSSPLPQLATLVAGIYFSVKGGYKIATS